MNKRRSAIISSAVQALRKQAAVYGRLGHDKFSKQYSNWADEITELLKRAPKGCAGCAYEHAQNWSCVDCARVDNRKDNFRRKFV